jgi:hypothetical protein
MAHNHTHATGLPLSRKRRRLARQLHPPLLVSSDPRTSFLRPSTIGRDQLLALYAKGRLPSAARSMIAAPQPVSSAGSLEGTLPQMEGKGASVVSQLHLVEAVGAGATMKSEYASQSRPRTRMATSPRYMISRTAIRLGSREEQSKKPIKMPSQRQPPLAANFDGWSRVYSSLRIAPAYRLSPLHEIADASPSLRPPASG